LQAFIALGMHTDVHGSIQQSSGIVNPRISLRGGEGGWLNRAQSPPAKRGNVSKLTRSYSISSITPTAADPTHLEQDIHSGPLDLNVITTLRESTIEVFASNTSKGCAISDL
jgi:hypothetical protein